MSVRPLFSINVVLIASLLQVFQLVYSADAEVVVAVIDEAGAPIVGAQVVAGWNMPREHGNGPGVGNGASVSGKTDVNGSVRLLVGGVPAIDVVKDGYYKNGVDGMRVMAKLFTNPVFALNSVSVSVVLSRIVNPMPMFVKMVNANIPLYDGTSCGFDLAIGDWVAPYGSGMVTDLEIKAERIERERGDWDQVVRIIASGPTDGIVKVNVVRDESRNQLRLPSVAPLVGYEKELVLSAFSHRGEKRLRDLRADPSILPGTIKLDSVSWTENDNYIFRVRSKIGVNGGVGEMYGKVYGPFALSKDGKALLFHYYLNPRGTRGLEWDMKNNLAVGSAVPLFP